MKVLTTFLAAALTFVPLSAHAYTRCEMESTLGTDRPDSVYQKLFVTATNEYSKEDRIILNRVLNFGSARNVGRRFFNIGYSGPLGGLLTPNYMGFNFPSGARPASRYLFAFLILDSGEYVQRMIMDPTRRQWFDFAEKRSSLYPVGNQITASFNINDKVFLNAFEKAKSMAIELRYENGETLARETYDVSVPPEFIKGALDVIGERYRTRKDCREWLEIEI